MRRVFITLSFFLAITSAHGQWYAKANGEIDWQELIDAVNERSCAADTNLTPVADFSLPFMPRATYAAMWSRLLTLSEYYLDTSVAAAPGEWETYFTSEAYTSAVHRFEAAGSLSRSCPSCENETTVYGVPQWTSNDVFTAGVGPFGVSAFQTAPVWANNITGLLAAAGGAGAARTYAIEYDGYTESVELGYVVGNDFQAFVTNSALGVTFTDTRVIAGVLTTAHDADDSVAQLWNGVYDKSTLSLTPVFAEGLPRVECQQVGGEWYGLLDANVLPAARVESEGPASGFEFEIQGQTQAFTNKFGTLRRSYTDGLAALFPGVFFDVYYISVGPAAWDFGTPTGILQSASETVSLSTNGEWFPLTTPFVTITNVSVISSPVTNYSLSLAYTNLRQYADAPDGPIIYAEQVNELAGILEQYTHTQRGNNFKGTFVDWTNNGENNFRQVVYDYDGSGGTLLSSDTTSPSAFNPTPWASVKIRNPGCTSFNYIEVNLRYAYPSVDDLCTELEADTYVYLGGPGAPGSPSGRAYLDVLDATGTCTNCGLISLDSSVVDTTADGLLPGNYGPAMAHVETVSKPAAASTVLGGCVGDISVIPAAPSEPATVPYVFTGTGSWNVYDRGPLDGGSTGFCGGDAFNITSFDVYPSLTEGWRQLGNRLFIFEWDFTHP